MFSDIVVHESLTIFDFHICAVPLEFNQWSSYCQSYACICSRWGKLFLVNGMSLQPVVAVVVRAYEADRQAELSLFELVPAGAFPPSISVSFLAPALSLLSISCY